MNLNLDRDLGVQYKSEPQRIRVMSEAWASKNAFCCACGGALLRNRNNAPVLDLTCEICRGGFELKSGRRKFTAKVPDGAYSGMIARLSDVCSPDFLFLTYDPLLFRVTDFFAVPTSFLDVTAIEKRRPLSQCAKRAGWVGCNILMHRIPDVGKVFYIKRGEILDRISVLTGWRRIAFLRDEMNVETKGWTLEILRIIQSLNTREFDLQKMYAFEPQLKRRFPRNNFIRAKIRQQLQVLRDAGLIEFEGRGRYSTTFD